MYVCVVTGEIYNIIFIKTIIILYNKYINLSAQMIVLTIASICHIYIYIYMTNAHHRLYNIDTTIATTITATN